ncbi:MAG: TadE/TadG family type IV pilus assembly protein [Paracoccaceae bacterium]
MNNRFINNFFKFRSDQKGSLSVEAIFAFPLLLWAATGTYTFFDAFKAQNASYRANYTISDMLSRETDSIGTNYMNGMEKVFRYMTHADEAGTWIRISQVQCMDNCADGEGRTLRMEWSHGSSGARSLTQADFDFYNAEIPLLAQADRLVLVETSMLYKPPFAQALVSFPERDLVSHVVTRPRFASQLIWDDTGYDPSGGGAHDDGELPDGS